MNVKLNVAIRCSLITIDTGSTTQLFISCNVYEHKFCYFIPDVVSMDELRNQQVGLGKTPHNLGKYLVNFSASLLVILLQTVTELCSSMSATFVIRYTSFRSPRCHGNQNKCRTGSAARVC